MANITVKSNTELMVRTVLSVAMEGLEMEGTEFGVVITRDMELHEIATAIKRLFAVDQGVSLRTRFGIGDLYVATPRRHGMREQLGKMIYGADMTPTQYQQLRTLGWVASKWKHADRSDKHTWSWYVANAPGKPPRLKAEMPETHLDLVAAEDRPLERVLRMVDSHGRRYSTMIPKSTEYVSHGETEEEFRSGRKAIAVGREEMMNEFFGGSDVMVDDKPEYVTT